MCGWFLPSKEYDPHRLYVACRGKSCTPDDRCEERHEWSNERCKSVVDYVEKLTVQRERKKERTMKSSSSFSGFSPSMPITLGRLPSSDSSVVIASASSSAMCAVTFTVAGPAVTTASVISTPAVTPVEHPYKRHRVTDLKERELMMLHFEDWWASGRSTPWPDPSSASQPPLITPPVVPAPDLSTVPAAVAVSLVAVLLTSSQLVVSSSCSAERSRSPKSPGPGPAPAPPSILVSSTGSSWDHSRSCSQTHHPSGGHTHPLDPSAHHSQSRSRTRHPSGGRTSTRTCLPAVPGPVPRTVTHLGAVPINGIHLPAVPSRPSGGCTRALPALGRGHHHSLAPARGLCLLTAQCHGLLLLPVRLLRRNHCRHMRRWSSRGLHLTCHWRVYLVVHGCTRRLGQWHNRSCPLRVLRLLCWIRACCWMLFWQHV